jgi:hypothetical protein
MDHDAEFYTNPDSFHSDIQKVGKSQGVCLIDDVGRVSEDEARRFYAHVEKHMSEHGGIIFFSDMYHRDKKHSKPEISLCPTAYRCPEE